MQPSFNDNEFELPITEKKTKRPQTKQFSDEIENRLITNIKVLSEVFQVLSASGNEEADKVAKLLFKECSKLSSY